MSERKNCYLCQDAGLDPTACTHWSPSHNPHLAAMLESIDDGIGLLAGKLAELGLAENTIFLFSSDNGGETNATSNAPLRGGKSQLYEGGIRVPLIVRGQMEKSRQAGFAPYPWSTTTSTPPSSKQPASNPIRCKPWTGFPRLLLGKTRMSFPSAKPFIGITHSTSLISSAGFPAAPYATETGN